MPYVGEVASKIGHVDILNNPVVKELLDNCKYFKDSDESETDIIKNAFKKLECVSKDNITHVVALDASPYSEPIDKKYPSTQFGYLKVSAILIPVENFEGAKPVKGQTTFVDPFIIAKLQKSADAYSFAFPGSNVQYKKNTSVKSGFREAVYDQLRSIELNAGELKFGLIDMLAQLGDSEAGVGFVKVHKCPNCGGVAQPFIFSKQTGPIMCTECSERVYITDKLRIHEQITDFGDCSSALTRFMNAIEHLVTANFVRMLLATMPERLQHMTFIVDGPLAIFGQPAYLSNRLMSFYYKVGTTLKQQGYSAPLIIGLQKTGALMDHALRIDRIIPASSYKLVDDEYRNKYITPVNNEDFGHETYFGQNFILKTSSGKTFVVDLLFPFENKANRDGKNFGQYKSEDEHYLDDLNRAFSIITKFEFDLYQNAVIPIALAHRHASISLAPGGKVLDIFSKAGLSK